MNNLYWKINKEQAKNIELEKEYEALWIAIRRVAGEELFDRIADEQYNIMREEK